MSKMQQTRQINRKMAYYNISPIILKWKGNTSICHYKVLGLLQMDGWFCCPFFGELEQLFIFENWGK